MKSEEIKRLVAKSENDAVEFKRARGGVPADFWPSYSSFANTDGGVIILGVREKDGKREIEGLADSEKIVADLWNAVNNPDKISANVLFNESIYPVDVDGKAVVIVEVPRAERTNLPQKRRGRLPLFARDGRGHDSRQVCGDGGQLHP